MVRLYWSLWAAVAAAALGIYLSGNFSMMKAVAFGFIGFGMTFMGMIGVLPAIVTHPAKASEGESKTVGSPQFAVEGQQVSPSTLRAVRNTHAAAH